MQKGFACPGYYFVDGKGIIREKFFDARCRERLAGNSLLAKLFPESGQEVTETSVCPTMVAVSAILSRSLTQAGFRQSWQCAFAEIGRLVMATGMTPPRTELLVRRNFPNVPSLDQNQHAAILFVSVNT